MPIPLTSFPRLAGKPTRHVTMYLQPVPVTEHKVMISHVQAGGQR